MPNLRLEELENVERYESYVEDTRLELAVLFAVAETVGARFVLEYDPQSGDFGWQLDSATFCDPEDPDKPKRYETLRDAVSGALSALAWFVGGHIALWESGAWAIVPESDDGE